MTLKIASKISPVAWIFLISCLLLVFALNLPVLIAAARQKFVISRGYGNMSAWNRSLWISNSSYLFAAICLPIASLGAVISGSRIPRHNPFPVSLLSLGIGLLIGPFWLAVLIAILSTWAPGFGGFEDRLFFELFSCIFLLPAGLGALIVGAVCSLRFKKSQKSLGATAP
jgi:hypothetical protein